MGDHPGESGVSALRVRSSREKLLGVLGSHAQENGKLWKRFVSLHV